MRLSNRESLGIDLKISKPVLCNLAKLNRVKRSGHISLSSRSQMVFPSLNYQWLPVLQL